MTTQSSRIINRLTGRGEVERDGAIICEVDYEIIISQITTGKWEARGRLRVLEGKRNLIGSDLALILKDGRKWTFVVTNGNPVSALYLVVQAGADSLAPGASSL